MLIFTCCAAAAASGPQTAWNVFTLPNPEVTPNWRTYVPADCKSDPEACAQDHRFWEEWDFSNFQSAIDASFATINSVGHYQAVMVIMPLGDTPTYWNNIQLMYQSAAGHGVQLEAVLFPKWKYGSEYCYLYNNRAPSGCQLVSRTTTAVAYQKLLNLMDFVQNLGGACTTGSYNTQFAVWYGWNEFSPGYGALKDFWQTLPTHAPTSACNLQASYITWLDSGFAGTTEVQRLQKSVVKGLTSPTGSTLNYIARHRSSSTSRHTRRTKPSSPDIGERVTFQAGRRACVRNGTRLCSRGAWACGPSMTVTSHRSSNIGLTSMAPWPLSARFAPTEVPRKKDSCPGRRTTPLVNRHL